MENKLQFLVSGDFKHSPSGLYYETGMFNNKKVYKHEKYGYLLRYTNENRWEINDMLIYSTRLASTTGSFENPWDALWNTSVIDIRTI